MRKKFKKGFSLIELLVVIAIIGILAAVGITVYTGYTANAKIQVSTTQHAQVVALINAEFAKCASASGSYVWPGATKDACGTVTVANIASYLNSSTVGLGMKNAYSTAAGAVIATGTATDGQILIAYTSPTVTITTDIGSSTLTAKVSKY